jgi:hypothetical protein
MGMELMEFMRLIVRGSKPKLYYIFLYLVLASILTSCSAVQKSDQEATDTLHIAQKVEKEDIIVSDSTFLALFPEITGDTIHIYSPPEDGGASKFTGKRIVPAFYKFFLFDDNLIGKLDSVYINIFSCYQVRLSEVYRGLIVRVPATYSETAIDLFLWDNRAKKIVGKFPLADGTGDAGWNFVKDAWLTDINEDNKLDILTRRKDRWQKDMDGMNGIERNTDSVHAYLMEVDNFKRTIVAIDTATFQLFDWTN